MDENEQIARQERREARRAAWQSMQAATAKMQFTGEKPSMLLYLGVAIIAVFKDLLDLVGIGSLPGIGTIITLCFTFLIWILLAIFDRSNQHAKANLGLARGLVVIFFGLVEAIGFGLNFLPIETLMVIVLYRFAKRAWDKAQAASQAHPITT